MGNVHRLSDVEITVICDPANFRSVEPLDGLIGQEKAVQKITRGIQEQRPGHHIIGLDSTGSISRSAIRDAVRGIVSKLPTPQLHDYCYVFNPVDERRPRYVKLPAGQAEPFRAEIRDVYENTLEGLRQYFESAAWQEQKAARVGQMYVERKIAMERLNRALQDAGAPFAAVPVDVGYALMAVAPDKMPLDELSANEDTSMFMPGMADQIRAAMEQYDRFVQELAQRTEDDPSFSEDSLADFIRSFNEQMKEDGVLCEIRMHGTTPMMYVPVFQLPNYWLGRSMGRNQLQARRSLLAYAQDLFAKTSEEQHKIQEQLQTDLASWEEKKLRDLLAERFEKIADAYPSARFYCEYLKEFTIANRAAFMEEKSGQVVNLLAMPQENPLEKAFEVNILLQNPPHGERPVILAQDVNYEPLFGSIHLEQHLGGYRTDHTKITCGDLLRANGGVLIVSFPDILMTDPAAGLIWEKLTRTLKTNTFVPEAIGQHTGLRVGEGLNPEPIPLNLKCILTMSPDLYGHFVSSPREFDVFSGLFKVQAPFEPDCVRTEENERAYAGFLETQRILQDLLPFTPDAFARMVECGSRMAGDKQKLSLHLGEIKELAIRANEHAHEAGDGRISRRHIDEALREDRECKRVFTKKRIDEAIAKGQILIKTSGMAVGRANGLAVLGTGDDNFGNIVTVTANCWYAKNFTFLSVDRSAKMTGKVFDKSAGIAASIILARYGARNPIPCAVSVSFEQLYDGIDGDSASVIEILVALSALGNIPLRQDIAITGSVNQLGDVQPIGGVNQKVEGFFDVCKIQGTLPTQAVLIPQSNVQNLVLLDEAVDACRQRTFSVYGYSRLEDAVEFATGRGMKYVDAAVRRRIRSIININREKTKKIGEDSEENP